MALSTDQHTVLQPSHYQCGFTLIELIIVITLMSAVGMLVAQLMSQPFRQYEDASRRAELASLSNAAVNRITIDLQNAVPNSMRVNNDILTISVLEILRVADGGRYRYADDADKSAINALAPSYDDDQFNVLGGLKSFASNGTINSKFRMVVNPFSTSVLYAAAFGSTGLGIITPASSFSMTLDKNAIGGTNNEDKVTFSSDFRFDILGIGSPRKRFYITDTPVMYRCSQATGELIRYTNYNVNSTLTNAIPAGADAALVLNNISSCKFEYETGISQRLGIVTIELQVTRDNEPVNLLKQVRVYNVP